MHKDHCPQAADPRNECCACEKESAKQVFLMHRGTGLEFSIGQGAEAVAGYISSLTDKKDFDFIMGQLSPLIDAIVNHPFSQKGKTEL